MERVKGDVIKEQKRLTLLAIGTFVTIPILLGIPAVGHDLAPGGADR